MPRRSSRLAAARAIDILVNNAGFSSHPTFARTDPESWQFEVNGNLNGAYYCAHAAIPGMKAKGGGNIVAIGSVNGLGALGDPAYSAAKAGLISLTRSLAQEYGRFNIRSNIVLPGTVRTPLWRTAPPRTQGAGNAAALVSAGPHRRSGRRGRGRLPCLRGCCAPSPAQRCRSIAD